jgi:hypothetical protein
VDILSVINFPRLPAQTRWIAYRLFRPLIPPTDESNFFSFHPRKTKILLQTIFTDLFTHAILRESRGNLSKGGGMNLSSLAEKWTSTIVARQDIATFTGGVMTPKTLANLDAKGCGPGGAFRIGGKVAYPVGQVVTWLESRMGARQRRGAAA